MNLCRIWREKMCLPIIWENLVSSANFCIYRKHHQQTFFFTLITSKNSKRICNAMEIAVKCAKSYTELHSHPQPRIWSKLLAGSHTKFHIFAKRTKVNDRWNWKPRIFKMANPTCYLFTSNNQPIGLHALASLMSTNSCLIPLRQVRYSDTNVLTTG